MGKETYKRDLLCRQEKRPIKETCTYMHTTTTPRIWCRCEKRPITRKRDLCREGKRPVKETCKRDLYMDAHDFHAISTTPRIRQAHQKRSTCCILGDTSKEFYIFIKRDLET